MAKINTLKLLGALPKIMKLIDLILEIAADLGVEKQPAVSAAEALEAVEAVGQPAPPDVEFLPLHTIYAVQQTTGDSYDPNAQFAKEWADPNAVGDEYGQVWYERTFRGLDANGAPIFKPFVISEKEARKANSPQPGTGNVSNKPYAPFPCRALYSWEKIEEHPFSAGGHRIRNLAYQPPADEPTEFTVGDRQMLADIHSDHKLLRAIHSAVVE
jgi:hypothetical protein